MDLFEAIVKRRSIRKYQKKEVEWYKIADILESGRYAPSAGNLQDWRFVVVREKSNIQNIANACFEQHWIEGANTCIIVCSDLRNVERLYGVRGTRLYAIQDISASVQNMLLTAHALELGACWVGAFNEDEISSAFGFPEFIRPQAIITLGYPDEKPKEPLRTTLETVTYFEGWAAQNFRKIAPDELFKTLQDYGGLTERRVGQIKDKTKSKIEDVKKFILKQYSLIREKINKTKKKESIVKTNNDTDLVKQIFNESQTEKSNSEQTKKN